MVMVGVDMQLDTTDPTTDPTTDTITDTIDTAVHEARVQSISTTRIAATKLLDLFILFSSF